MASAGLLMYTYEGEPFETVMRDLTYKGQYSTLLKQYFIGLLQQVASLHHAGLAHLDIKPSNVLVKIDSNGCVVTTLIDYEFVARNGEEITRRGSRGYWAPELGMDNSIFNDDKGEDMVDEDMIDSDNWSFTSTVYSEDNTVIVTGSLDMYSVVKTLLCEAVNDFQHKSQHRWDVDVSQWVEDEHGGWREDVDPPLRTFLVSMASACLSTADKRWSANMALEVLSKV